MYLQYHLHYRFINTISKYKYVKYQNRILIQQTKVYDITIFIQQSRNNSCNNKLKFTAGTCFLLSISAWMQT